MLLRLALLVAATAVCASCSSEAATPEGAAPPSVPPGVLVEKQCPGGDCNAGFSLDGRNYLISCKPASPKALDSEVLGSGRVYGRQVTFRRVAAGSDAGKMAIGPMDGYCGNGRPANGYYLLAPPLADR